jgi:hypothetical protein
MGFSRDISIEASIGLLELGGLYRDRLATIFSSFCLYIWVTTLLSRFIVAIFIE